jgi:hypothetical protein
MLDIDFWLVVGIWCVSISIWIKKTQSSSRYRLSGLKLRIVALVHSLVCLRIPKHTDLVR